MGSQRIDDVASFFKTKLAEEKPKKDPLIDPGEAAAAGVALAYGPLSQQLLPYLTNEIASKFMSERMMWEGDPAFGIKRISEKLPSKIEKEIRDIIDKERKAGASPEKIERLKRERLEARIYKNIQESQMKAFKKPQKILGGLFNVFPKKLAPSEGPLIFKENIERLADIQKSVDSMLDKYKLPEKGVTMSFRSGPVSQFKGPTYSYTAKEVVMPEIEKAPLLHEIGHAAHYSKRGARFFDFMRDLIHRGANLAVPMAYIAGNEIKEMFPGKIDDKAVDFVQKNAPAILASTFLATNVYPEVQASARAIGHVYKTEGTKAAKSMLKQMAIPLAGYTMPIIPAVVAIGMARKWHREAAKKREKLERQFSKEAKLKDYLFDAITLLADPRGSWENILSPYVQHASHGIKQIAPQLSELFKKDPNDALATIYKAGTNVVKSPQFASGAAEIGIPSAIMAYLTFNTPHNRVLVEKYRKMGLDEEYKKTGIGSPESEIAYHKYRKKSQNITTPAIIGMTAALSGGFLRKFFHDINRVM